MISYFNRLISLIKGQDYTIDPDIPLGYMVKLACLKALSMLYGNVETEDNKEGICAPIIQNFVSG